MTSSIPPSGSTSKLAFPGAVLVGKFRLEQVIGVGGMGSVWEATHLGLNQQIAIKLVSSQFAQSKDALRRFDNEAKAAAKIKSRHVPQVYDNGVLEDGTPYLAMELLHGETLFNRIHKGGPIPLNEAAHIVDQCCRALGRAHSLGIIHRDIKPENIFLAHSVDDDNYVVKVLDFGIAKMTSLEAGVEQNTRTGALLGTPMFMSPEQARGSKTIDHRTDLYSLGLTTFMMFTGNLAFNGETLGELLLQICTQPLPSLLAAAPWLPPNVESWFQKACARDANDRFANAQAFAEALRIAGGLSAAGTAGSYVPSVPQAASSGMLPGVMPMGRPPGPMDLRPAPTASDVTVPRPLAAAVTPHGAPTPQPTPSVNANVALDGTLMAPGTGGRSRTVPIVAGAAVLVALIIGGAIVVTRKGPAAPVVPPVAASPSLPAVVATAPPAVAAPSSAPSASVAPAASLAPVASVVPAVAPPHPVTPPPTKPGAAVVPPPSKPNPTQKPGNVDLGY